MSQINWSQPPLTRDRRCYVGTIPGKTPHGEFKIWCDPSSVALYYTKWRDRDGGVVPIQTRLVQVCNDLDHAKSVASEYKP